MGYRAYPEYKDSGVESFGDIPDHWQLYPLKFGLQIPITDGPHETPELLSEGIPFLSAEAVKNDRLNFDRKRGFISEEEHARFSKKYRPQKGDIYMVKSGATTGNVTRVETDEEFNIWSPLAAIRPNPTMTTTDFIFYFMKSKSFFYAVEQAWSFGTQQNIGMGAISNLKIAVPPVHEQEKIGTFLNYKTAQIDRLIEKKQELIEKLQEQRMVVIKQAVTQGLNNSISMQSTEVAWFSEAPSHWRIMSIKHMAKVGNGSTPARENADYWFDGTFPWLNSSVVNQHSVDVADQFVTGTALRECHLPIISPPAILVGITGQGRTRGMSALLNLEATINQHLAYIKPESEAIQVPFLLQVLISAYEFLRAESEGGGSTKGAITCEQLGNLKVPVPPVNEQKAIAEHISNIESRIRSLIDKAEAAITRLQEYRTALITAAVTGQIDVRDWQAPEPTKESAAHKEVA